jgi:hypothetical protein
MLPGRQAHEPQAGGSRMLELKWVAGPEEPQGLALANGRLDVGDNADLVGIDPATVAITARPVRPHLRASGAVARRPAGARSQQGPRHDKPRHSTFIRL